MTDSHDNSGLDGLVRVIESLQERIRNDGGTIGSNEIRTRTALVDPLLNALGWDTTDPTMVIPEYAAGGGVADYALLKAAPDGGSPVIAFVEAKRLHEPLEPHRPQMLNYANMSGVKYAGLTNGDRWELYEVFKEAPLHERRIVDVSLRWESAFNCAVQLLSLQWPSLETGGALSKDRVQQLLVDALMAKAPPAIVAMLLDKGANANLKLRNGRTVLHLAVEYARPASVAVLLDHGADVNAKDAEDRQTPLHIAARSDQHKEVIALLLSRGADKEARDDIDMTPLHTAVERKAWAVAELLLDEGMDINIKGPGGMTPLQWAIECSNVGLYHGTGTPPPVVRLLLDRGADIEVANKDGRTPLHSAAIFAGKRGVVTLLLNRGAAIEATDNAGETSLHHAVSEGQCFSAGLLLDRGANIEAKNHQGMTPLHLASRGLVARYPVIGGKVPGYPVPDIPATATRVRENGREYVEYTHWEETHEIIKLLIEYGADRIALTDEGKTAYQIAEAHGASEDIVRLLQ